jgi:hypothetical protein
MAPRDRGPEAGVYRLVRHYFSAVIVRSASSVI